MLESVQTGFRFRVYYEDTDAGGVVYHANYLRFMERARSEWLRLHGFEQGRLRRDPGVVFTVTRANLRFLQPAWLDDELRVTVHVSRQRRASLEFEQQLSRVADATLLCEAEVKVACLGATSLRPCGIPAALLSAIAKEPVRVR